MLICTLNLKTTINLLGRNNKSSQHFNSLNLLRFKLITLADRRKRPNNTPKWSRSRSPWSTWRKCFPKDFDVRGTWKTNFHPNMGHFDGKISRYILVRGNRSTRGYRQTDAALNGFRACLQLFWLWLCQFQIHLSLRNRTEISRCSRIYECIIKDHHFLN